MARELAAHPTQILLEMRHDRFNGTRHGEDPVAPSQVRSSIGSTRAWTRP